MLERPHQCDNKRAIDLDRVAISLAGLLSAIWCCGTFRLPTCETPNSWEQPSSLTKAKMDTADAFDFWEVAADDEIGNLLAGLLSDSEEGSEAQHWEGPQAGRLANIESGCKRYGIQLNKE